MGKTTTTTTKQMPTTRTRKTLQPQVKPKYRYLKGYRELIPDPWELGLES